VKFEQYAFEQVLTDVTRESPKVSTDGYLSAGSYPVVDQGAQEVAGYVDDASLVTRAGSPRILFGDHSRRFKFASTDFVLGADGVKALKVSPGFDPRYVFHALRKQKLPNAGYSRHFKFLKLITIAAPELDEQRRIATILDQADELRAKRRRTLTLLDEMQQAAFGSKFDPAATSFRVEQVGQHVSLRSGKFLPRKAMATGDVPVFGGNGVNGYHDTPMFSGPKIVIGRVGAQCGAVHITPERSWVTDNAMVCTWDASALRLEYLADALRFAQLNQYAATTDLRQLSAGRVAVVPLVVPPLAVQDRYIADMRQLGDARRGAEAHLAYLDELFASLQHRAFTGQL
jgi:type I restriction enzyme S subunit